MTVLGLSAKVICWELCRLVAKDLGLEPEIFTQSVEIEDRKHAMYGPGFPGGLTVTVNMFPTEFQILAAGRGAVVQQGGADRFVTIDAYSRRFLEPAASILCNSIQATA